MTCQRAYSCCFNIKHYIVITIKSIIIINSRACLPLKNSYLIFIISRCFTQHKIYSYFTQYISTLCSMMSMSITLFPVPYAFWYALTSLKIYNGRRNVLVVEDVLI